jgi:hypothetical protein
VVLACGSSTPEPETPEPGATAEEAPADVTTAAPAADAGPPAQ